MLNQPTNQPTTTAQDAFMSRWIPAIKRVENNPESAKLIMKRMSREIQTALHSINQVMSTGLASSSTLVVVP